MCCFLFCECCVYVGGVCSVCLMYDLQRSVLLVSYTWGGQGGTCVGLGAKGVFAQLLWATWKTSCTSGFSPSPASWTEPMLSLPSVKGQIIIIIIKSQNSHGIPGFIRAGLSRAACLHPGAQPRFLHSQVSPQNGASGMGQSLGGLLQIG